jgi:hypothetical protein
MNIYKVMQTAVAKLHGLSIYQEPGAPVSADMPESCFES